ncbi:MAG TPA: hypothetical protein VJ867_14045, partial [Gemmatimonadaceae bacterium]|nr:hypothetical protein [Gemmatimonadaceae bacterium]
MHVAERSPVRVRSQGTVAVVALALVACELPRLTGGRGPATPDDPPALAQDVVYSAAIPDTLWRASRDSVPDVGNYTFLTTRSPNGPAVSLYTDDISLTRVSRGTATVAVSISGAEPRIGVFVGSASQTFLPVGYFTVPGGAPFSEPAAHGLFDAPDPADCAPTGWFAIDTVRYA